MNNISDTYKNEPKRYTASGNGIVKLDPKGELVLFLDYADLQAFTVILDRHEEIQYRSRAEFEEAFKKSKAENARLKAEVERLQNNCDYLDQKLDEEIDKSAMLCGQVMRLTKAGDAVALDYAERIEIEAGNPAKTLMKTVPVLREWTAAKEGKPSA